MRLNLARLLLLLLAVAFRAEAQEAGPDEQVTEIDELEPAVSSESLAEMETGEMTGQLFDELTDRLAQVRLPTVCVLNGSVYGGGATLAMSCDFRVGTPEVRLSVPAARLGVMSNCYLTVK